jgi:hypothetical protein
MEKSWINPRGNSCEYERHSSRTSDYYDQKFSNTNWQQLDTYKDSPNFSIWINSSQRRILIFADGAQILIVCKDFKSFKSEMAFINERYRSQPI